ncbi:MAG: HDOD domain-containing protein, partial [Paraglaciecola sp.]|uniref:HDOD domain-containing protein n=1 Tax=Paraglaciecola sp. TaxID=1920173 RepID=UPI003298EDE8
MLFMLIFASLALCILLYFKQSPKAGKQSLNTLVKHREKRMSLMPVVKSDLPDAAKVHAHEKKLKELEYAEIPESFYQFELIQDIDSDTEIDIKNHLQTIRKPHPLLQHLVHNISDPKKLYDVIKTDPELVAKIINVANSPLFGLEKPITNVNHAVIYLGV